MTVQAQDKWGKVLICGGTDWATNGRKDRAGQQDSDLYWPYIVRSLSHLKITSLITGPAANYAVAIDEHGAAHMFGKLPASTSLDLTETIISGEAPIRITPRSVGSGKLVKFIGGAAGRSHVLLVGSDGNVWACGNNIVAQLGLAPRAEVPAFTRITGPWMKDLDTRIVSVSAGHTFSLFLTNTGQVYATGSSEAGQLGNGKTGERLLKGGKTGFDIEFPPRLVQGLNGKKIVRIASGNQHSLAVDEDGYVYAWGYAGYCRLGLGDQKDRYARPSIFGPGGEYSWTRHTLWSHDEWAHFSGNGSVVIDRSGAFHIAGKWKLTGDGSAGQAYTTFKKIPELYSCKTITAAVGGCTYFLTAPGQEGVQTIGFGQGCLYGELGNAETKSASKPVEVKALTGLDIIQIAAGAYFTLFLARPNESLSEVTRWPEEVESDPACYVCGQAGDKNGDPVLECERCEAGCHKECCDPPLAKIPEGDWFCRDCEAAAAKQPDPEDVPGQLPTPNASASPVATTNATLPRDGGNTGQGNTEADTEAEVEEPLASTPRAKGKVGQSVTPRSARGGKRKVAGGDGGSAGGSATESARKKRA